MHPSGLKRQILENKGRWKENIGAVCSNNKSLPLTFLYTAKKYLIAEEAKPDHLVCNRQQLPSHADHSSRQPDDQECSICEP